MGAAAHMVLGGSEGPATTLRNLSPIVPSCPRMTTRRYPRVLVIDSAFFSRRTNVGIVLSNLFDGWPKHSLAQICYNIGQPDFRSEEHTSELQSLRHLVC